MWLNDSNRDRHLLYGFVVWMIVFCFDLPLMAENDAFIASYEVICSVGLALEFKDYLYGSKPDILDFIATILIPTVFTVIYLLWTLL